MVVIGELLHRKCNAAIPLVDVGTDVFALRDDREDVARIQVKTARGEPYKNGKGYYARFNIPIEQLDRADEPPLFYALVVRLDNRWGGILVISRAKLKALREDGLGSENKKSLALYVRFRPRVDEAENGQLLTARCGKFELTDYINAWESLPPLKPPIAIDVDEQDG